MTGMVPHEQNGMQQQGSVAVAPIAPSPAELATAAAAASAVAAIQARFAYAMAHPRNIAQARTELLEDCKRPKFADKALYTLPRGKDTITRPNIRFAEAGIRAFRNLDVQAQVVHEAPNTRLVDVCITDMQTNVTYRTQMLVEKTVERKFLKRGQQSLGERLNSHGDKVYLVAATEADVRAKTNSEISKAIRELALRLLPADLVEEAEEMVWRTRESDIKEDPDRARKNIEDAFVALGVQPVDLERYLRHPTSQASPAEVVRLRTLYESIRSGETSWADVIEEMTGGLEPAVESTEGKASEPKSKSIADKLRKGASGQ